MVWETLEGLSPNIPLFQPSSKQVKATPGWVSQLCCSSRWPHKSQWFSNISLSATLHGRRWVRCYNPLWRLLIPRCKLKGQHRLEHLFSCRGKELPDKYDACSNFCSNATHVLSPHIPLSKLHGQTSHWWGREVSPPTGSPHRSH